MNDVLLEIAEGHAGKMSRPILERVGFRTVRTSHALVDST